MRRNLTDRYCQTTKATEGRKEIIDTSPKSWNLMLRVTPTSKSWWVRYRINGKRPKKMLGTFPSIPLKEARALSVEIGGLVQKGIDPEKEEAEARLSVMTLHELLDEYIEEYCKRHQKKSWKQTEQMFENWVTPRLGDILLPEINRGKILEFLHDLEEAGLTTQVNRIFTQIKACLTWGVEEKEYLLVNPVETLYRKKRRVPEDARARFLSDDELRTLWMASEDLSDPSRSFIRILMLTGQRRDEVRLMEWRELDLEKKEWLLPASRTKPKREHLIPLSNTVVEILKDITVRGDHVFTVNGKAPYSGQKRLKTILDRETKLSDWVFHDLRRTFSTGLGSMRISDKVNKLCMNHAANEGITGVYNRHNYIEEKREAFEAWDNYLMMIVGEKDVENVISLPGEQHG